MAEHDPVNHPTHYASEAKCSGCGESIECIDVVRHMGFDQGNAMKYLWRAGKKDAAVQDLKKAIWYIEDMIAELEGRKNPNVHRLANPHIVNKDADGNVTYDNRACQFSPPTGWGGAYDFFCKTHNVHVQMPLSAAPKSCNPLNG